MEFLIQHSIIGSRKPDEERKKETRGRKRKKEEGKELWSKDPPQNIIIEGEIENYLLTQTIINLDSVYNLPARSTF